MLNIFYWLMIFLILLMSYEYTFIDGAEKVKDYIRINGFDYKNACC